MAILPSLSDVAAYDDSVSRDLPTLTAAAVRPQSESTPTPPVSVGPNDVPGWCGEVSTVELGVMSDL